MEKVQKEDPASKHKLTITKEMQGEIAKNARKISTMQSLNVIFLVVWCKIGAATLRFSNLNTQCADKDFGPASILYLVFSQ